MLKPVPMAKIVVVGPKTQMAAAVNALHQSNLVHIEDYSASEPGFELGSPLPHGAQTSERLLRIRGVIKGAQVAPPARVHPMTASHLAQMEDKLGEAEKELLSLIEQRNALLDESKRLGEEEGTLRRIRNFPLDLGYLAGYRSLAIAAGIVPPEADLAPLRSVGPQVETLESQEQEGRFVAVFAPRAQERTVQEALGRVGFQSIEIPRGSGTAGERLGQVQKRQRQLHDQLAALDFKMARVRERHAGALLALDEHLTIEAEKATAPVRFRTTRHSFMVEGWVPRDNLEPLQALVSAQTRGLAYVAELEIASVPPHAGEAGQAEEDATGHDDPTEAVPVKLYNAGSRGAYEVLTETYARPRYRELDPTLFFYFGFPLFFGIMLGDIGYATLLLVMVGTGVFTRLFGLFSFQSTWHLNRIILHSAVMSLLFGVLYGELFGLEIIGPAVDAHGAPTQAWIHFEAHWGVFTLPLSRFHNVKLLLALSLVIAVVHMTIGLFLGLRNGIVAHGFWAALKHRGCWIFILLAITLPGVSVIPPILGMPTLLPWSSLVGYAALASFLLGTVLLVLAEGPTGLFELPTILSNLLSYTRLVAIGLSSAGIALAGNEVSRLGFDLGGVLGFLAGALILLVFHLINLALGIIGPALHSLRLHYVEFFTKFYEGGGVPYTPFGSQRKFTLKEAKQA